MSFASMKSLPKGKTLIGDR